MTASAFPPTSTPADIEAAVTAAVDRDRLWLLELGYYVSGVVTILGFSVLLLHFTLFLVMGLNPQFFANPHGHQAEPPPPWIFLMVAGIIAVIMLLGWIFGALQLVAGRCIKHRRHALFIQILAGLECIFIPWGTLLGVCTFFVLDRPSVKKLFN